MSAPGAVLPRLFSRWKKVKPPAKPAEVDPLRLPAMDPADPPAVRDYRLLAGGLALLLSRCTLRAAERDFPACLAGWRGLQRQLRDQVRPELDAEVLSDMSHEIATLGDITTREALRRCLHRRLDIGRD